MRFCVIYIHIYINIYMCVCVCVCVCVCMVTYKDVITTSMTLKLKCDYARDRRLWLNIVKICFVLLTNLAFRTLLFPFQIIISMLAFFHILCDLGSSSLILKSI